MSPPVLNPISLVTASVRKETSLKLLKTLCGTDVRELARIDVRGVRVPTSPDMKESRHAG